MEGNKLVKIVGCYLVHGDNVIGFWLNKYYENGESSEESFNTLPLMESAILKYTDQGAIFGVEVFEV